MTRSEYVERVLSVMRHTTFSEQEAIRAELSAHIEDHICDLLDLDYPEDLAEERTMALMGDPEEVGRELDKQYPLRWLVLGRVFLFLLVVLSIVSAFQLSELKDIKKNILVRYDPQTYSTGYFRENDCQVWRELDLRTTVGNDVIYIYGTGIIPPEENRGPRAVIGICVYDEKWLGIPSYLLNDMTYVPQHMEALRPGDEGWLYYNVPSVRVTREDTYVTVCYEAHGYEERIQVPVCWEEYDAYETEH